MLKVTTESGAVYLVDEFSKRINRLSGPMNPLISIPNDAWEYYSASEPIEVGYGMYFDLANGLVRGSTYVTEIVEV